MNRITPFTISIPDTTLNRIRDRVATYPWQTMPDLEGWEAGASKAYMQELCDYWLNDYDWRAAEARLNRFANFKASLVSRDNRVASFAEANINWMWPI